MSEPTVLLLTGPDRPAVDAARADVLARHAELTPERLDLAEHGIGRLLEALSSGGLFVSRRLVDVSGGDEINADAARTIAAAAAASDAVVVVRGGAGKPHAAVVKALSGAGESRHFALPGPRELPGRVRDLAAAHGVRLDASGVVLLVERAGHDLERVDGLLRMLARADVRAPQLRQLDLLLGSSSAPAVPWQVTDAVERGDAAAALAALERVDPQALLAFLARRLGELGRVAEAQAWSADAAAAVLGGPAWRARAAVGPARALGADAAADALADVVATTAAARGDVTAVQVGDLVAALAVRLAESFTR